MPFCHAICIYFSGFMPQEVGENQRYSRVFYMAPSLIGGGCLLVNYRWLIFHFGNPIHGVHCKKYEVAIVPAAGCTSVYRTSYCSGTLCFALGSEPRPALPSLAGPDRFSVFLCGGRKKGLDNYH